MERYEGCLLCGGLLDQVVKGIYDTRYGTTGSWDIARCSECSLIQLGSPPSLDKIEVLYESYYNFGGSKTGMYTRSRSVFLQSFIYHMWMFLDGDISFHSRTGRGRLLDVGCNEGRGLQIYRSNGFETEGLELNEVAGQRARGKGFTVYTELLEKFQPEELYDIVVLSNVIEHSLNPKSMLNHVHRILKAGGEILISCPNIDSWQRKVFGKYWINWHVPFHITFFSISILENLLNEVGFEVRKKKCVTPSLWTAQSMIGKLFAQKGKKNYAQRSPILLGSLIVFVRFIFFPLLWLGNFLGRGDCVIIEAQKKYNIR